MVVVMNHGRIEQIGTRNRFKHYQTMNMLLALWGPDRGVRNRPRDRCGHRWHGRKRDEFRCEQA
jgi:hypothetical protein